MAIENEQELAQAVDRLANLLQSGNASFADMEKQLKKSNTGLKAFGQALSKAPVEIGAGIASFSKQIAGGDTSLKSFNTVVDTAAGAAGSLAKAIPVVGDAFAGAIKAVADASKFLVDQLDATAKSFNEISEVGAAMGDGMTGLRRQFEQSGLSLQQYSKVIKANSETMAQFRGLTGKGAEDFSSIVGDLTQGSDDSLRRLGMSADQIGNTTAAYVKQQTLLGRSQYATNEQLRQGTIEYAKELDILSKVTGQNREAIQAQQDAALSESRFRAVYERMMSSGQTDAAKALMGFQTVINGLSKETGQGIRDLSSGIVDSAAAQKVFNSTNGAALDIVQRLKAGQIDQAQAQTELTAAMNANIPRMQDQAQYNKDAAETQIGLSEAYKIARARFDVNNEVIKDATAEQNKQISATDQLTKDTVAAQKAVEGMAVELNKMTMTFLPDAAKAVNNVSTAMKSLFTTVREELEKKESEAMSGKKGALAGAASMGAAGALIGSVIPGVGTVVGGALGAGIGGIAGSMGLIDYGIKPGAGAGATAGGGGGDVEKILATIRKRESGGDYGIKAKGSTASGAYQFIDSTWQGLTKQANLGQEYKSAKDAPKEVQDAIAKMYVENLLKQAKGDVSKIPLAWYTGNLEGKMSPEALAANNGLTAQKYQSGWMSDYNKIASPSTANLSGPSNLYTPSTALASNQNVTSSASGSTSAPVTTGGLDIGLMTAQLEKLEEIASVMKNQLSVSTKLLQMSS